MCVYIYIYIYIYTIICHIRFHSLFRPSFAVSTFVIYAIKCDIGRASAPNSRSDNMLYNSMIYYIR